jgi:hypothetical protein
VRRRLATYGSSLSCHSSTLHFADFFQIQE